MVPEELREVERLAREAKGYIDNVYLHWTAGHYDQSFEDYHICILEDGTPELMVDDFTEHLAHTWNRNSRAIGIALDCCVGAVLGNGEDDLDFGEEPPTPEQIDGMAKVMAILSYELGLPISYEHFKTHCEAAEEDDYGPSTTCERWDLYKLLDHPTGKLKDGGEVLRGKAEYWFKEFYE